MEDNNMSGHYYGFVPHEQVDRAGYGMQQAISPAWMARPQQQVVYRNMYQPPVMPPGQNVRWKSNPLTANQFGVQVRGNYNLYANNSAQPMAYGRQPYNGVGFGPSQRLSEFQQPRISHPMANVAHRFHGNQNISTDDYGLLMTTNREDPAAFGMNQQRQALRRNAEQQQHFAANHPMPHAMQSSPIMSPRSCHSVDWSMSRGAGPSAALPVSLGYGMLPPTNSDQLVAHHQSKFRAGVPTLSSPATSPPYSPSPAGLLITGDQSNMESRSSYRSPMTPLTPDNRNTVHNAGASSWMQRIDGGFAANNSVTSGEAGASARRSSRASVCSPQDTLAFSPTQASNQPYRFQWQLGCDEKPALENALLNSTSKDDRKVIVPFGWQRLIDGHAVKYVSPSGISLSCMEEVRAYLTLDGVCKCGLECPVRPAQAFNFDADVVAKTWSLDLDESEQGASGASKKLAVLCAHKRKILAIAAFQRSALLTGKGSDSQQREEGDAALTGPPAKKKRLRKKRSRVAAVTALAADLPSIAVTDSSLTQFANLTRDEVDSIPSIACSVGRLPSIDPPISSAERLLSTNDEEARMENDDCEVKLETEEDLEQQVAAALNAAVARLKCKRQRTPRLSKGRRQSSASLEDSAYDIESVNSETSNSVAMDTAAGQAVAPTLLQDTTATEDNHSVVTVQQLSEDGSNVVSGGSIRDVENVAVSSSESLTTATLELRQQSSMEVSTPRATQVPTEDLLPQAMRMLHSGLQYPTSTMVPDVCATTDYQHQYHQGQGHIQMQYVPNHHNQHQTQCFDTPPTAYRPTTPMRGPFGGNAPPAVMTAMPPRAAAPSLGAPLAMVERMISNLECAQRAMVDTVTTAFIANPSRSRRRRKTSPGADAAASAVSPAASAVSPATSAVSPVVADSESASSSLAVGLSDSQCDVSEHTESAGFVTSTPTAAGAADDRHVYVEDVSEIQESVSIEEPSLPRCDIDTSETNEQLELADGSVLDEANSKPVVDQYPEVQCEDKGTVIGDQPLESEKDNDKALALEDKKDSEVELATDDGGMVAEGDLIATEHTAADSDVTKEEQVQALGDEMMVSSTLPPVATVAKKRKRAPRKPRIRQPSPVLPSEVCSSSVSDAALMQQQQQLQQQAAFCVRPSMCAPANMAVFTAVLPPLVAAPWMGGFVHPAAFLTPPLAARPLACIPYEAVSVGGLPVVDCATSPLALGQAGHLARFAPHLQQPTIMGHQLAGEGHSHSGVGVAVLSANSDAAKFNASDMCTQTDFLEEKDESSAAAEDSGSVVNDDSASSAEESSGEDHVADSFAFDNERNRAESCSDDVVFTDKPVGRQKRSRSATARSSSNKRHRRLKRGANKLLAANATMVAEGDVKDGGQGELESDDSGLGTSESNPRDHIDDVAGGDVSANVARGTLLDCAASEPDAVSVAGPGDEGEDPGDSLLSHTFGIGDLVWGLMRGYTPWPGMVVPETEVKGTVRADEGKFWVRWFGDHTCSQVEPAKLKTLTEGLDLYHQVSEGHRKSRKMNASLEAAIDEAMREMDRQAVAT